MELYGNPSCLLSPLSFLCSPFIGIRMWAGRESQASFELQSGQSEACGKNFRGRAVFGRPSRSSFLSSLPSSEMLKARCSLCSSSISPCDLAFELPFPFKWGHASSTLLTSIPWRSEDILHGCGLVLWLRECRVLGEQSTTARRTTSVNRQACVGIGTNFSLTL